MPRELTWNQETYYGEEERQTLIRDRKTLPDQIDYEKPKPNHPGAYKCASSETSPVGVSDSVAYVVPIPVKRSTGRCNAGGVYWPD
jgi:hypothetical protein